MRRRIAWTLAVLVTLASAAVLAVGWYYAGEIKREAFVVSHQPAIPDLIVAAASDGTVMLRTTAASDMDFGAWRMPGIWGLAWEGGYGRVGDIVGGADGEVTRTFTPMRGAPAAGAEAWLDGAALDGDPLTALGLPFEDVTFPAEFGPLGAWMIPGTAPTWAILVHGKGQTRAEMLRYLAGFVGAGLPCLVIEYRNDENVWRSASGYYDYGISEWRDLEAAVRFALGEGADGVVLVGASMGGGIAMSFLYRSELADSVRAVVLDAPMLDFSDTVTFGAERRSLPAILTWIGKTAATLRFGFPWEASDYIRDAARLNVPVLVFHGDADRLVHIRSSEALAAARPDLVTLVRVAGGRHVHAWNMDPAAFEQAVGDFLQANVAR